MSQPRYRKHLIFQFKRNCVVSVISFQRREFEHKKGDNMELTNAYDQHIL